MAVAMRVYHHCMTTFCIGQSICRRGGCVPARRWLYRTRRAWCGQDPEEALLHASDSSSPASTSVCETQALLVSAGMLGLAPRLLACAPLPTGLPWHRRDCSRILPLKWSLDFCGQTFGHARDET